MEPVFTTAEMRGCDAAAVEVCAVPGVVLMENAARGAADVAEAYFGACTGMRVLVVAGKGNNGGDGFAIARHFANRGADVRVATLATDDEIKGDARANLVVLRAMERGGDRVRIFRVEHAEDLAHACADDTHVVVDALFGTGLNAAIAGIAAGCIEAMNASGVPILAIDVPSGIDADTGRVTGPAVRAACTATMGGRKRGLLFGEGRGCAGSVRVVDIGMPRSVYVTRTNTFLFGTRDAAERIPERAYDVHKYRVGSVFSLAGSPGLTGAACLSGEAALRIGAGIVHIGVPASLNPIFEEKLTEVMTIPLAETALHTHGVESLERVFALMNAARAGIVGPGLSRHEETLELARHVVRRSARPLVVDADALFALAGHLPILRDAAAPLILTPHAGEFARLTEGTSDGSDTDPIEPARRFATDWNVTLVLKGAPTIVASADGIVTINESGNPGMATAGMGDVLSGVIAGLIAQGLDPVEAARTGVSVHGAAGDRAAERTGEHGLLASDLVAELGPTLRSLAPSRTTRR